MHRAIPLAFLVLFTGTAAQAAGAECGMKTITACSDTNSLVWAKSFQTAIERFAGKKKVRWLGQRMPLHAVVSEVLSAGGDPRVEVAPGLYRFDAFRHHSAIERGAVFIDADGAIKAAGVLHFNCEKSCSRTYHLSVILRTKDSALEKLVRDWGDEEARSNAEQGMEEELSTIAVTDVVIAGK